MTVVLRRLVVALAGGLLASGGFVLAAAPAVSAPTAGACTDATGVTVVVDFGRLGGGVQVRCAPGPVTNGFEALTRAGFAITSVSRQAFLCRIDSKPADDPCNRTPSAASYWSYWHAERGEAWRYSSSGASRRPPAGTVEGWSFGGGDEPSAAPPGPISAPTTIPPSVTTSPPPTAGAVVTTPGAPATTAPSTTAPSSSPSTTESSSADPVDRELEGDDGLAAAADRPPTRSAPGEGNGSPVGVAAAAVLVSGLGVVGFRTARRRARAAEVTG